MNMNRITGFLVLSLWTVGLALPAARAASPRSVTSSGVPVKWNNTKSIVYSIDLGPLGKLSNTQAAELVTQAFQQWSSVKTAKLTFEEGDPLDRDVTGANLSDFINGLASDVNPIIFDNDGTVTDAFLGNGASQSTLAVGGPYNVAGNGVIVQGIVIINARAVDGLFTPDDPATDDLTRAIVRAIGQMLGVGSSDTNDELIFDGNPADTKAVPVMHPSTGLGHVIGGGSALTLDDQMAVSALYPADSFSTSTGTIQGQVLLPDGTTGVQGIDVIARKVDDPLNSAVSAISGVTFRTSIRGSQRGAEDVSQRGAFTMNVPAGNYTLEFRPLRQPIGPLGGSFPLPGGDQFYQASAAPSPTAGPAIPASATPVTVTAGQTTTVKFVAAGKPAPAPQMVTQVKPDGTPLTAQLLPLSATITGNASPMDPAPISVYLGPSIQDKIENLYRLVVPERSILTLYLQPKDKVVLELFLLRGFLGGANQTAIAAFSGSASDTGDRSLQVVADPGTYFIGASVFDGVQHPVATDYTLSVTTTPLTGPAAPPVPVLNQLVVGDVTATSATASWVTDIDTTGDAISAIPRHAFGDPMPSKAHRIPVMGLTAGSDTRLTAVSQSTDAVPAQLPSVFFRTADSTAATGPAQISASVIGMESQTIGSGDAAQNTILVEIGLRNSGGPATNVQITGLTPSAGWMLAQPLAQPLTVGGIGSDGTAIVVVRLLQQGTSPATLASVAGTGTLAGAGGTAANFSITGP